MRTAGTIALRELAGYFRQPAGWIIIALYLLLCGVVFITSVLVPGRAASLRDFFALSGWLLLPVVPAISMRLIADELRSGTIEQLLTSPVSSLSLVVGKYLGGLGFIGAMLIPTVIYPALLFAYSSPSPSVGPMLTGYLCLLLLGSVYLALGLLVSCLTSNATLAFMVTLFAMLGVLFLPMAAEVAPPRLASVLAGFSIGPRVVDFSRGALDTAHLLFFILVSSWLILACAAVMEVRRWR